MWNYDKELDQYQHVVYANFYITCLDIPDDRFLYKKFTLHDKDEDTSYKLISTDLYSALDEGEYVIERLTSDRAV